MAEEDQSDKHKDEFDFYMGYAKKMASKLNNAEERARVSSWIVALSTSSPKSEHIVEYTKLLLWALHCHRLVGPFSRFPGDTIEPYPKGYNAYLMGLDMLTNPVEPKFEDVVIRNAVSSDMKEYFAVQTVPDFGIHCCYAFSDDRTIADWEMSGDLSMSDEMEKKDSDGWKTCLKNIANKTITRTCEPDKKEDEKVTKEVYPESEEDKMKDTCQRVGRVEEIINNLSELGKRKPQNIRERVLPKEEESPCLKFLDDEKDEIQEEKVCPKTCKGSPPTFDWMEVAEKVTKSLDDNKSDNKPACTNVCPSTPKVKTMPICPEKIELSPCPSKPTECPKFSPRKYRPNVDVLSTVEEESSGLDDVEGNEINTEMSSSTTPQRCLELECPPLSCPPKDKWQRK